MLVKMACFTVCLSCHKKNIMVKAGAIEKWHRHIKGLKSKPILMLRTWFLKVSLLR